MMPYSSGKTESEAADGKKVHRNHNNQQQQRDKTLASQHLCSIHGCCGKEQQSYIDRQAGRQAGGKKEPLLQGLRAFLEAPYPSSWFIRRTVVVPTKPSKRWGGGAFATVLYRVRPKAGHGNHGDDCTAQNHQMKKINIYISCMTLTLSASICWKSPPPPGVSRYPGRGEAAARFSTQNIGRVKQALLLSRGQPFAWPTGARYIQAVCVCSWDEIVWTSRVFQGTTMNTHPEVDENPLPVD